MDSYAELLEPWAAAVGGQMLRDVSRRNEQAWKIAGEDIGRNLQREILFAPTGQLMQSLLHEQVVLIQSIPREAGQRVHRLTSEGITTGTRAREIAKEILRTEEVTASRATLIARTEVARTSSLLTQSRAQFAGSVGYLWRTSHDFDVRESHAEMEGVYVRWDSPPHLSDGTTTHAGQIYNCRCYPEPVLPKE